MMPDAGYQIPSISQKQKGATLLEMILYVAIFAIVIGSIVGILFAILRIQNSGTSAREVSEQGRFVLQMIQREVRDSSLIDIATNTPIAVLVIRHKDSNRDYVAFYASGTAIWMDEGTTVEAPPPGSGIYTISTTTNRLTNENVTVDAGSLVFRRIYNSLAKNAVQVDFTLSFNSDNPKYAFSKSFGTTIARVSAAVFDSDIIPGQDNIYSVGLSSPSRWKNINISNLLNVGQLSADPVEGQNGSIYYNTASSVFREYASGSWRNLGDQWGANGNNIYYNTGKVGIGTLNIDPNVINTKLNVYGNSNSNVVLEVTGNAAGGDGVIQADVAFSAAANILGTNGVRIANIRSFTEGVTNGNWGGSLDFATKIDGSGLASRIRIDENGNVGIGTTTPSSLLQVFGTATVNGFKLPTGASNGYVLTSDASGNASWQATSAAAQRTAEVKKSSNQSVTNATWTALTWDTETEDFGGLHDSVTNNSRFTIPAGGLYLVCANVSFATNSTDARRIIFYINGGSATTTQINSVSSGQEPTILHECSRLRLAANDYIEVWARQDSGGSLNVRKDESVFSITLLAGQ
ncbi:MAG: type II secretion system protein [Candidatus Liptonbacteria bacterium]|nr:type II secretion system protein [Candidatus Liptonbacteria bacterium]